MITLRRLAQMNLMVTFLLSALALSGCGVKGDPEAPPERSEAPQEREDGDPWWKLF